MENPPFEDVISYRNYSNCSSRKSISVPFFLLIQKFLSPKRCNKIASPRLRGRFFKRVFFWEDRSQALPVDFSCWKDLFASPPEKIHHPGVWFFQSPRLSCKPPVPQKIHVQPWSTQAVFFGNARSRLIICCHGESAEPWELSRPDATNQRSIPLFINEESSDSQSHHILKEKDHFRFLLPPKRLKGLGPKSVGFSQNWSEILFFRELQKPKFQICHLWVHEVMAPKMSAAMIDKENLTSWVAYLWAHSNDTLGLL